MKSKLSILVFSCDAYSDLWDGFFGCFDYYWKDREFPCYLVNNNKSYLRNGINVINAGDGDWSSRTREALKRIDSPYVLTFLDDYFVSSSVNNKIIQEVLKFIESQDVSYYQLDITDKEDYENWSTYKESFIYDIPKTRDYWIDTSIAIWNVNFLLELLGDNDYSAWEFELARNIETKSPEKYADKLCLFDSRRIIQMCPMVIQGKYYPKSIKLMTSKGHDINISQRSIMSIEEVFKHDLKRYFSKFKFGRRIIKAIGRKLGYVFMSDEYLKKINQ